MNLGSSIEYFNPNEMLDTLGYKMIELMKTNCDQVKKAAAWFVANLINC